MKVNKPWGHEIRWAITDKYLGKILKINKGHRLSLQFHETKDESLYVLEGTLSLEIHNVSEDGETTKVEKRVMLPGSAIHIKPGMIHRLRADHDDCTVIEVSTPEIDDVVRLKDSYGRH